MNSYHYSLANESISKLSSVFKLYTPFYRGIAVGVAMTIVVYTIISMTVSHSIANTMLPFMSLGIIFGVFLSWLGVKKTIKKIAGLNRVEWNDGKVNFLKDGEVVYTATPDALLVQCRNDVSIFFYIKTTNKYMRPPTPLAISLPDSGNHKFRQFIEQWEVLKPS